MNISRKWWPAIVLMYAAMLVAGAVYAEDMGAMDMGGMTLRRCPRMAKTPPRWT